MSAAPTSSDVLDASQGPVLADEASGRWSQPSRFFESELPGILSSVGSVLRDGITVRFIIEGPGGGVFDLVGLEGGEVRARPTKGPHDCIVCCHSRDWESCMSGRMPALRAYADGRLQISGDVGLLLAIQDALCEQAA